MTDPVTRGALVGPALADDLEQLLLVRRFEERLLELYSEGQVGGTTHTCLGQEHIPVALAPLLREDFVMSNHRGHGHYLAHTGDLDGLLAEMLGREGAVCRGVGGSQHLRRDRFMSTGVQGESLPVAAGVALHYKHSGQHRIAAAYIGDGTWGEGAVYEALNMARLWSLPLLVVVEHNGIAQTTPTEHQMAGTIAGRAAGFGVGCTELRGTDVAHLRAELAPLVDGVRVHHEPHVVVVHTHRLGPHSKGDDVRPGADIEAARRADWLPGLVARLPQEVADADRRVRERLDDAIARALAAPLSTWEAA